VIGKPTSSCPRCGIPTATSVYFFHCARFASPMGFSANHFPPLSTLFLFFYALSLCLQKPTSPLFLLYCQSPPLYQTFVLNRFQKPHPQHQTARSAPGSKVEIMLPCGQWLCAAAGERSFHSFYELLAGASPRDRAQWCAPLQGWFKVGRPFTKGGGGPGTPGPLGSRPSLDFFCESTVTQIPPHTPPLSHRTNLNQNRFCIT